MFALPVQLLLPLPHPHTPHVRIFLNEEVGHALPFALDNNVATLLKLESSQLDQQIPRGRAAVNPERENRKDGQERPCN